jgi:hypothetical protein
MPGKSPAEIAGELRRRANALLRISVCSNDFPFSPVEGLVEALEQLLKDFESFMDTNPKLSPLAREVIGRLQDDVKNHLDDAREATEDFANRAPEIKIRIPIPLP